MTLSMSGKYPGRSFRQHCAMSDQPLTAVHLLAERYGQHGQIDSGYQCGFAAARDVKLFGQDELARSLAQPLHLTEPRTGAI